MDGEKTQRKGGKVDNKGKGMVTVKGETELQWAIGFI